MILIEKSGNIQKKDFRIKEYITKDYLYTESKNGDIIYLKRMNNLYRVNHDSKTLKVLDVNIEKTQINRIKNILPEPQVANHQINDLTRICDFEGRNTSSIIKAKVKIKSNDEISNTCYKNYHEFSAQLGVLKIPLNQSEIIENMDMNLNIYGNVNSTSSKTLLLETIDDYKIIEKYDKISNYPFE
ncbi:hypothetical protein MHTCC0001_16530 [Flavobacteriaceae bacterium MHTCC 0001]